MGKPSGGVTAMEAFADLPLIFEPNPGTDGLVQGYAA